MKLRFFNHNFKKAHLNNAENSQWSFDPTKDLTIGQSGNEVYRGDHLNAVLDDLQMWHARRDILLYQHLIHSGECREAVVC